MKNHPVSLAIATCLLGGALIPSANAQTAYSVDGSGNLFSFNLGAPSLVNTIGNLGFVPEGLDFRPGTGSLYAVDIGATSSQLYRVDLLTGAATAVGAGFNSVGVNYSLSPSDAFGFDFNPKTLQADGSIRIRLTSSAGADLRLHSDTGGIAAVDLALDYPDTDPNAAANPLIIGSAYINNIAQMGGTTTLFNIDASRSALVTQAPPNNGQLNTLAGGGLLGVEIAAVGGFDIFTDGNGNSAYASLRLTGETEDKLFSINLGTGAATFLGTIGAHTAGGFAVVPEPSTYGLLALAGAACWFSRKKMAKR